MKKILIFALTAIIILSAIVISTFAMDEVPYAYVLEFTQTQKAYPVSSSFDDVVPMRSYYEEMSFSYGTAGENGELTLSVDVSGTTVLITAGYIYGSYPYFDYSIPTHFYDDFGIYVDANQEGVISEAYVVGFKNGQKYMLSSFTNMGDGSNVPATSNYFTGKDNMSNGYYVSFPVDPVEVMNDGVVGTTIESIGSFVLGLGSAFAVAFESVFMLNGQLNALSIFLLVLFGCALSYGCVRWITGLFRKET